MLDISDDPKEGGDNKELTNSNYAGVMAINNSVTGEGEGDKDNNGRGKRRGEEVTAVKTEGGDVTGFGDEQVSGGVE